jgi:hypothetical protein
MANEHTLTDFENLGPDGNKAIPSTLNVLTILTFIGCAIVAIFLVLTPWLLNFSKEKIAQAESLGGGLSASQEHDLATAKDLIAMAEKNMTPNLIIGAVCILLCFVGALWMRKLKKDGYWLYLAGEVIPLITSVILMGTSQYSDWKGMLGVAVVAVFVVLYTMQRKYLVK